MIEAVLFDLDDTLYSEGAYCRSGFRSVGAALAERGLADADEASTLFASIHFGEGRDGVFDKALDRLGLDRALIPELVQTYREHRPTGLAFYPDCLPTLASLRQQYRLGVVTDGWLVTQRAKVEALGLEEHVDQVFLADTLGRAFWKPHPRPFLACLEALAVKDPGSAVFIGDNPERDVEGALAAGLIPIWLRRGDAYFRDAALPSEPRAVIESLAELPRVLAELEDES